MQEIKELKKQLGIRDKDISNMTASLNKLERNICQVKRELFTQSIWNYSSMLKSKQTLELFLLLTNHRTAYDVFVQHCNNGYTQALDENEELRRRLGIDPSDSIDLSGNLCTNFSHFNKFLATTSWESWDSSYHILTTSSVRVTVYQGCTAGAS